MCLSVHILLLIVPSAIFPLTESFSETQYPNIRQPNGPPNGLNAPPTAPPSNLGGYPSQNGQNNPAIGQIRCVCVSRVQCFSPSYTLGTVPFRPISEK